MSVIFSGIQPTGVLHIGNYLGAIQNWQNLIEQKKPDDELIFSIVDLHAITVMQRPDELRLFILQTFAMYLACGIKPADGISVFVQSSVRAHTELAWILSCNTPMGFLDRMTQYKDKTQENKERACLGLYSYPVLMAADILLYNTDIVPVGDDQVQHIELTRDLAERFNRLYGDTFVIPKYIITENKRIMSLKDGSKKMSKSEESDSSRINLLDSPELIAKKIQKATTGSIDSNEMKNLILIYRAFGGINDININSIAAFKKDLADSVIAKLSTIQSEFAKIMNDHSFIEKTIKDNTQKVNAIAEINIAKVKNAIGI